jgi:hypothetical protein
MYMMSPPVYLPRVLLTAALLFLQRPAGAANLGVGDTFTVGGCSAEVIGCYWDQGGKKGCLASC